MYIVNRCYKGILPHTNENMYVFYRIIDGMQYTGCYLSREYFNVVNMRTEEELHANFSEVISFWINFKFISLNRDTGQLQPSCLSGNYLNDLF